MDEIDGWTLNSETIFVRLGNVGISSIDLPLDIGNSVSSRMLQTLRTSGRISVGSMSPDMLIYYELL